METRFNFKLLVKTLTRYILALAFVGAVLFLPAGSLSYWNGWLYVAAMFIPMLFAGTWLFLKDPGLLEKRMKTREREKPQKAYLIGSIPVFAAVMIVPGLDYRFGWSDVPLAVVIASTVIMVIGYILFFLVMRQNSYASRVVEIQEEQKLIDSGLYRLVRHPMYLAAVIIYGFTPLVLGSLYGLIPMIFIPVLLVIRIRNEEKVLARGLKGYGEYREKVKYRLIPYLW